ncbi:hypothetical protein EDD11_003353 [Mortierella claussenii]|nr:hypothetical protein EDD11_003353 [Mortierella claussenii]
MSADTASQQPGVLIVGAGIGGLLVGVLFERLGYSYHIFERATKLRPLGSAMSLGVKVLPVFEQLGLLEELMAVSLPCPALDIYKADRKLFGSIKLMGEKGTGYDNLIFERSKLFDLLLRHISPHRITLSKKVLRTEEKDDRVAIHCSDGTMYEGDILIGADGAYSGVRQSLYKQMESQGILPKVDQEEFTMSNVCMVGVAQPADPSKHPQLKDGYSHFSATLGEASKTCSVISVPNNRVCWSLIIQLSKSEAKAQQFRNSEWGPESNEAMIKEFENAPCPWGGSMGDIVHSTPKDLISKVFLEEKVFKTWYHGRTVLIGDACHKMLPGAGQGAVNAMHDAVVLVNCIYNMEKTDYANIKAAFKEYYRQRYHHAVEMLQTSRNWSMAIFGQRWTDKLLRYIMVNTPEWMFLRIHIKNLAYRPQISWLPLVETRGVLPALPQEGPRKLLVREQTAENGQPQRQEQVQVV